MILMVTVIHTMLLLRYSLILVEQEQEQLDQSRMQVLEFTPLHLQGHLLAMLPSQELWVV